jgi:hypothetical protein
LCQFFPGCSARCACNSSSDVWLTNSLFSNVCSCCDSYAARSRERHVPTQKAPNRTGEETVQNRNLPLAFEDRKGGFHFFGPLELETVARRSDESTISSVTNKSIRSEHGNPTGAFLRSRRGCRVPGMAVIHLSCIYHNPIAI